MDADHYRAIMRHQAGAVTVIACGKPGERSGLTATAVASLSDRPPTVIACVNQTAGAHDEILRANAFSVNLLANEQQTVAERFAGKGGLKGEDRFTGLGWRTLTTGSPILIDALASLDCELVDQHTFSTHSIFIGRVVAGQFRSDVKPLLYFRGDYWDVARGVVEPPITQR
jgi:flavin reductase (DIM6/NTAB) family NADH-FMN oxidoreductase RutF